MTSELKIAIKAAEKAGQEVLKIYRKAFKSWQKKDRSILTEADIAAEKIIISYLKRFNYPILSEETKDDFSRLNNIRLWIVDPLDGTLDFVKKTGQFSIMTGLIVKKKPVLGVIYYPIKKKLYFAEEDKGAFLKTGEGKIKKIKVSKRAVFKDSKFAVSNFHLGIETKKFVKRNKIKTIKTGSIGIKLGLLAEGKTDGYITYTDKTHQWDTCAGEAILWEAGGEITDLKGKRFIYNRKETRNHDGVVASNGLIHKQILKNL